MIVSGNKSCQLRGFGSGQSKLQGGDLNLVKVEEGAGINLIKKRNSRGEWNEHILWTKWPEWIIGEREEDWKCWIVKVTLTRYPRLLWQNLPEPTCSLFFTLISDACMMLLGSNWLLPLEFWEHLLLTLMPALWCCFPVVIKVQCPFMPSCDQLSSLPVLDCQTFLF